MNLEFTAEDEAFRGEVRRFLDEKFTPELRARAARQAGVFAEGDLAREWHKILHEQGWAAPAWPKEYGGPGWTPSQRYIFDVETGLAGTPSLPGFGLQMCGPVVMRYGTREQKEYFLPRILSCEHYWCQGYSEPNSGSDLASLQTRAVRDGDDYVVNGSKIWTTHAHNANWIFILVRTDQEAKPQRGISFLLTPLDAPGITVTPIISMSGEHEVNQVFFDNVRIPVANRMGEENQGWSVAKYLLEFERGGRAAAPSLYAALERIRRTAGEPLGSDPPKIDDDEFAMAAAAVESDIFALDSIERLSLAQSSVGNALGDEVASMKKLLSTTIGQDLTRLQTAALGRTAWVDQRHAMETGAVGYGTPAALTATARYLNARASTIFGGSTEVQKNILAKVALGL